MGGGVCTQRSSHGNSRARMFGGVIQYVPLFRFLRSTNLHIILTFLVSGDTLRLHSTTSINHRGPTWSRSRVHTQGYPNRIFCALHTSLCLKSVHAKKPANWRVKIPKGYDCESFNRVTWIRGYREQMSVIQLQIPECNGWELSFLLRVL